MIVVFGFTETIEICLIEGLNLFAFLRKILDDNLDEETKAAQKEEMERKQRLLEIQEKLRQQALELRAQREKEMLNNSNMEKLKNSALKTLLEGNHCVFVANISTSYYDQE